ncbi:MAG: DUF805 domain-containing protein [Clostridiales Family XIII bacterium]|nr:DUF805 domain-containing protein [Clostridiales Family XIII bacterium]
MFCRKCGTENPDRARFCEQCGAAMQAEDFGGTTVEAMTGADGPRFAQDPGGSQWGAPPQYASADSANRATLIGSYVNMWKNYANFRDRTQTGAYWFAFLGNVIVEVVLYAILTVGTAAQLGGLVGFVYVLIVLYGLANLCPSLALTIRRLRDTGRPWPWIFIGLIPLAGSIIFIVLMCGRSVPDDGTRVV